MPKDLKIALVGIEAEIVGGASAAEKEMAEYFLKLKTNVSSVIFTQVISSDSGTRARLHNLLQYLDLGIIRFLRTNLFRELLKKFKFSYVGRTERRLLKDDVDLIVFLRPGIEYELITRIPFFSTIWDLGHLDLVGFEEMYQNLEFERRDIIVRDSARKSVIIFADSKVTCEKMEKNYGIESGKLHAIPFTVQAVDREIKASRTSSDFAVYPAHFWSHKNHKILLRAQRDLLNRGKVPLKLFFTGADKGHLPATMKMVHELQLDQWVENLGFVSRTKLNELYSTARIVVFPSYLGPTNIPPLESLSFGCPVALSDRGAYGLEDLSGVTILDPDDLPSWSKALDSQNSTMDVDEEEFQKFLELRREENQDKIEKLVINFAKRF